MINGCNEELNVGNISLLFGQSGTLQLAPVSRNIEQIAYMESTALAFFDDPIIDEVAFEQGIIEPICLDENPGNCYRKYCPIQFNIHRDVLKNLLPVV